MCIDSYCPLTIVFCVLSTEDIIVCFTSSFLQKIPLCVLLNSTEDSIVYIDSFSLLNMELFVLILVTCTEDSIVRSDSYCLLNIAFVDSFCL